MKKLSCITCLFGLLLAFAIPFTPGCTTTNTVSTSPVVSTNSAGVVSTNNVTTTNATRTLDIALTTNTINIIVPLAVTEAVIQAPQSRQYLTDAATAINVFLGGNNYTPAALDAALGQINSKALQNPQTLAAINSAVGLYEASYAQVVEQKLNQVNYLVPILHAIANGITAGLAATP